MVEYWNYFLNQKIHHQVFLISSIVLVVGLSTSPAFMSIGCAGLVLGFLLDYKNLKSNLQNFKKPVFFSIMILYFIHLLPIHQLSNSQQLLTELRIKIPFILIPLGFFSFQPKKNDFYLISFFFLISLSLVSLLTLGNYLLHFEEMNHRILESKEIPVVTKVTHIYFSVMLAFGIFLSYHLGKVSKQKFYYYFSIFLLICLHLFTSRTGLVGFYIAIFINIIFYIFKEKHKIFQKLSILLSIFLLPVLAYFLLPSFQNRVINTLEDIQRYKNKEDINHRSVSMRLVTWEMGYLAFKKNPWFGVGMENISETIHKEYESNQVPLKKENWLNDLHNQFFEYLLGLGVLGFVVFIFWLCYPISQNQNEIFLQFIALLFGTMFAESLLERQVGVCFGIYWYYFLYKFSSNYEEINL